MHEMRVNAGKVWDYGWHGCDAHGGQHRMLAKASGLTLDEFLRPTRLWVPICAAGAAQPALVGRWRQSVVAHAAACPAAAHRLEHARLKMPACPGCRRWSKITYKSPFSLDFSVDCRGGVPRLHATSPNQVLEQLCFNT